MKWIQWFRAGVVVEKRMPLRLLAGSVKHMLSFAMPHLSSNVLISRWLPRITEVGMVLLTAWLVAGWLAGGTEGAIPLRNMSRHTHAKTAPSAANIAAMPLFGVPAKTVAAAKPAPSAAEVPAVKLRPPVRLRLLGTMLAGAYSAAVIVPGSGNKQKLVFVNETIQPGVLLRAVKASAIEVDNHGRLERIFMKKPMPGVMDVAPVNAVSASPLNHRAIRHMSRAFVDAELNDLPTLLTQVRAIPHRTDGKPDGFLIRDNCTGIPV